MSTEPVTVALDFQGWRCPGETKEDIVQWVRGAIEDSPPTLEFENAKLPDSDDQPIRTRVRVTIEVSDSWLTQ